MAAAPAGHYNGMFDCMRQTANGGRQSLYAGFTVSLIRVVPLKGIMLGGYATLKDWWGKDPSTGEISTTRVRRSSSSSLPPPPSPLSCYCNQRSHVCGYLLFSFVMPWMHDERKGAGVLCSCRRGCTRGHVSNAPGKDGADAAGRQAIQLVD